MVLSIVAMKALYQKKLITNIYTLSLKVSSESEGGWIVFARVPDPMCIPVPIVGFGFGDTGKWVHIKEVVQNAHYKLRQLAHDPFRISSVQIRLGPRGNPWASDTEGERVEAGAISCGYPNGKEVMLLSCSAFPGFPLFDEMLCILVGRKLGLLKNERLEQLIEISGDLPVSLYISHLRTATR
jgi:hypothetical protein